MTSNWDAPTMTTLLIPFLHSLSCRSERKNMQLGHSLNCLKSYIPRTQNARWRQAQPTATVAINLLQQGLQ